MIKKKPKRQALWLTAFPKQAIKSPARQREKELAAMSKGLRRVRPSRPPKPASHRKEEKREYRIKAKAFVKAAIVRGETCPVVAAVPELRDGHRYGWPISNRLNEVHHTRGRAGSLLCDERFWLAVSKQGHRWIHANIEKARNMGFLCAKGEWNHPPKNSSK
jgi:hypothetical protein